MDDAVTARWWRRNAIALAAVAVLLPTTAVVVGGNEWWNANQADPVFPTTVGPDTTVEFGGATWGPARWGTVAADTASDAPAGARAVVIEVPVDPRGKILSCGSPMLRETGGENRRWINALADVDWSYDAQSSCPSDEAVPFTIEVPYLVPDDATGPFDLELALTDQLPGYLVLRLP
jgi:hypothetical protein